MNTFFKNQIFRQPTLIVGILLAGLPAVPAATPEASKPTDAPPWKQSAGLGFTLTHGNSDTLLFTGNYSGAKKWGNNELAVTMTGGYGENNNVKSQEYANGSGQYNWLLGDHKQWYGFGKLGALYDAVADIDYRFTPAIGLGYYLLKEGVNDNKHFNLSVEVGPGFVAEKVGGVPDDYATLYGAQKFTWKINDRANLWQSLNFTPEVDDMRSNVTESELGISSKITEAISTKIVLTDTYRTRPAAGLEHNDLKLVTGLNYSF